MDSHDGSVEPDATGPSIGWSAAGSLQRLIVSRINHYTRQSSRVDGQRRIIDNNGVLLIYRLHWSTCVTCCDRKRVAARGRRRSRNGSHTVGRALQLQARRQGVGGNASDDRRGTSVRLDVLAIRSAHVPFGSVVVVMLSTGLMVIPSVWFLVCCGVPESVAVTVILVVPAVVGMPVIVPEAPKLNPPGIVPAGTVQVMVPVPPVLWSTVL